MALKNVALSNVDESSRTYLDVKLEILARVEKLDPGGQRLPSEREWCDMLTVSRSTVRQALLALETEGRIQRKRGSGWYVSAAPLRFDPCRYVPFTYTAIEQGRVPSWQEIEIAKDPVSPEFAAAFGIRSNRRVPKIQVLLELDADPVGLETSYINPLVCADPAAIDHSLPISKELQRVSGIETDNRRMSIKSTNCGGYAAKLMGLHAESPALLMTQWIQGSKGKLLSISETVWRANALEFVVVQSGNGSAG